MMTTRFGADPTGVLVEPQAGTSEQSNQYPDVLLQTAFDYLHYIDRDINGEPLDLIEGDDINQVLIAGAANRTQGGEVFPLPFAYELKYDSYAEVGKVVPESTVNFTLDDGRVIDTRKYKIVSDNTASHIDNPDAYRTTIFMSEELASTSILTKAKYTRILDDVIQVNFKDTVDPQEMAKLGRDYSYFIHPLGSFILISSNSPVLGALQDGDSVWVKKASVDAINCLPPIGLSTSAWKPRVTLGSFVAPAVDTIYGLKDVTYSIPDVTGAPVAVNWAAGFGSPAASGDPYLSKAAGELAYEIDPYTVQLPRRNVYFWDGDWGSGFAGGAWSDDAASAYPDYVTPNIIDTTSELGAFGISDQAKWSHGINIYDGNELVDNSTIFGWNKRNGIIKLSRPLSSERNVTSTYLYEQREVEVDVDLNPTLHHPNTDRAGDTVRVVLKPEWDSYSADTGDTNPNKLAWHWLSDNSSGVYDYNFTSADGTTGISYRDGSTVGLPEHTVILGDYSIGQPSPYEANLIDTRVRGGGIRDDVWFSSRRQMRNLAFDESPTARRQSQRESEYFWDIGYMDGEPYQADGSLIISIPSSVATAIEERIVAHSVGETKITPEDRDMVDASFATNGEYDLESLLSGISDQARVDSIKLYVALREEAPELTLSEMKEKINKHIALGEFYVLIDENTTTEDRGNTTTNSSRSPRGRRRFRFPPIPGIRFTAGDASRERDTAIRESFPDQLPHSQIRGF
jgi:hypothetical protein